MKKIYAKPEIIFEDFSLAESIAAGCEKKINNPSKYHCGYPSSNNTDFFTDTAYGCDNIVEDGTSDFPFCYHAPNEDYNLFNS